MVAGSSKSIGRKFIICEKTRRRQKFEEEIPGKVMLADVCFGIVHFAKNDGLLNEVIMKRNVPYTTPHLRDSQNAFQEGNEGKRS